MHQPLLAAASFKDPRFQLCDKQESAPETADELQTPCRAFSSCPEQSSSLKQTFHLFVCVIPFKQKPWGRDAPSKPPLPPARHLLHLPSQQQPGQRLLSTQLKPSPRREMALTENTCCEVPGVGSAQHPRAGLCLCQSGGSSPWVSLSFYLFHPLPLVLSQISDQTVRCHLPGTQ